MAEPVTTDEKPAALPPELATLATEAAALEAEQAPAAAAETGAPIPAPVDYLSDSKGLVDIAAEALAAFYPSTAPILTTEKRGRIAGALAPVLEKYGLDMASIFGKWGAEIALAFAVAPIAIPLVQAIRADRAAADRAKLAEAAPPPAVPSAATTAAPPPSDLYAKC